MILFIAPNPHKVKDREGFLQRVAAIDEIFDGHEKVYFDDLTDKKQQAEYLVRAQLIYVHSIYNANKILPLYKQFGDKIVTDFHGVVLEEEEFAGHHETVHVLSVTEKTVFQYGRYFVAVSHAMAIYFKDKYNLKNKQKWVILPVRSGEQNSTKNKVIQDGRQTVIYAGGGQKWQNIGRMVEAINKTSQKYVFKILTHDQDSFKGLSNTAKTHTEIRTVASERVKDYYRHASLGFILRDDIVINNVACPTKLIEYLQYGVVPIVLSEKIGDFESMGYKYIKLNDFLTSEIGKEQLQKAILDNFEVFDKFIAQIRKGIKDLREIGDTPASLPAGSHNEAAYTELLLDLQDAKTKNLHYEFQIEYYKEKINEYADLAHHYRTIATKPVLIVKSVLKNKLNKMRKK